MFTQQTVNALRSLHDLAYKADELHRQTSHALCVESRDLLLSAATRDQLTLAGSLLRALCVSALLEGLRDAQPFFAGTPFEPAIPEIIAGYVDGSPLAEKSANVALAALERGATDWHRIHVEAAQPLIKYTVSSAFGKFIVEARSPEMARMVAAAENWRCTVDELKVLYLRDFSNGVPVE